MAFHYMAIQASSNVPYNFDRKLNFLQRHQDSVLSHSQGKLIMDTKDFYTTNHLIKHCSSIMQKIASQNQYSCNKLLLNMPTKIIAQHGIQYIVYKQFNWYIVFLRRIWLAKAFPMILQKTWTKIKFLFLPVESTNDLTKNWQFSFQVMLE